MYGLQDMHMLPCHCAFKDAKKGFISQYVWDSCMYQITLQASGHNPRATKKKV